MDITANVVCPVRLLRFVSTANECQSCCRSCGTSGRVSFEHARPSTDANSSYLSPVVP